MTNEILLVLKGQEKEPEACQYLGEYMEAIEKNMKGAYELFRKNCLEHKFPKSCYKYAMYRLMGKG